MDLRRVALGIALLVCLSLLLPSPALAQEPRGTAFGIKGGWILSDSEDGGTDLANAPLFVSDERSGFAAGGFVVLPLGAGVAFQPEVLYSRREIRIGANPGIPTLVEGDQILFAPVDTLMTAEYVEVPLLVRLGLGGETTPAHALVGTSLGFNVGASLDDRVFPQNSRDDATDAVSDLDVGLVFGGGITIGRLVVDGRYNLGFVDIRDEDATLAGVVPAAKWRSFALMAGFVF